MFGFAKNQVYAIGVDLSGEGLRLAQLGRRGQQLSLIAGSWRERPAEIDPGTPAWQRWAIGTIREMIGQGGFRGRVVTASMLPSDVVIENIRMPKVTEGKIEDALFAKVRSQTSLRCSRENALIRCIPTDPDNALVMVADRERIDRHLAIYDQAGLSLKAMGAWPEALATCYAQFFGRRKGDLQAIVMLVDVKGPHTNVVVCRHSQLLFARSIPIGADRLGDEKALNGLVLEVAACRRDYASTSRGSPITRVIFLSGPTVETAVYAAIAKQVEVQAQVGDCLAAVEVADPIGRSSGGSDLDRRECPVGWATAFGLSLS